MSRPGKPAGIVFTHVTCYESSRYFLAQATEKELMEKEGPPGQLLWRWIINYTDSAKQSTTSNRIFFPHMVRPMLD